MSESLQEFVSSRGATMGVDRGSSVIRGVKVLGLTSRNGRSYAEAALAAARGLYEGAKVNVNHPKGPATGPRDYQDRIGVLRDVRFAQGEGLFADLQINPKHSLAEQLLWDAEHAAENVGLSHNVEARTSRQGDAVVVDEILRVQSVDLVADPAATRGLFEAKAALPADQATAREPTIGEPAAPPDELTRLREECESLRSEKSRIARRSAIRGWLSEYDLPDPDDSAAGGESLVDETFVAQLQTAASDEAARRLIVERAALVEAAARWHGRLGSGRPTSGRPKAREQAWSDDAQGDSLVAWKPDGAAFARAMR